MNESLIKIIIIALPIILFAPIIYFIVTTSRKKEIDKIIKNTNVISSHEDDLREISTKTANISKEGIEITARTIKNGFINEKQFCKHCGASIDSDSKFCKNCGKEQ